MKLIHRQLHQDIENYFYELPLYCKYSEPHTVAGLYISMVCTSKARNKMLKPLG